MNLKMIYDTLKILDGAFLLFASASKWARYF